MLWVSPCAGQRSDQVIPGQIYDQVHLVRSDQVYLVMTRCTWSDDQVPGHIYPGKYPGAQVTRYPGPGPGTGTQEQEKSRERATTAPHDKHKSVQSRGAFMH